MISSSATRNWPRLATPTLEARISPILGEIAETLWARRGMLEPSLAGGLAGAALFLGYLSQRPGCGHQRDRSFELLAMAIGAPERTSGSGLYSGYPGLAWCVEHLRKRVFPLGSEDPNVDVDASILAYLDTTPWAEDYDLIGGLVGLGVYGLERLPEAGGSILLKVLEHLEALSSPCGPRPGLAWQTPPSLLVPWQRKLHPRGYLNYGLAHGIPGILALVAAMHAHGLEPSRCGRLLEGGMAALRWQMECAGGSLPDWCPLGQGRLDPKPARVAWCYGELGASLALRQVAMCAGRSDWAALARNMARGAASRSLEASGVKDAGLCHGAAGNAHLFNRWFQFSGEPVFRAAALAYLEQTLAFRNSAEGFAGFTAFHGELGEDRQPFGANPTHKPSAGLLGGAAGVGLALLSSLGGLDPAWDRLLLISTPLRQGIR